MKISQILRFNKREKVLIISSFLIGTLLMYLHNMNVVNENQNNSREIIENAENTLNASYDLVNNYQAAYEITTSCVFLNPKTCDTKDTADKLYKLGDEREEITARLQKYTEQSKQTFDRIKNNK